MTDYEWWQVQAADAQARSRVFNATLAGRFAVVMEDYLEDYGTVWEYVADYSTRAQAQTVCDGLNGRDEFVPCRVVPGEPTPLPVLDDHIGWGSEEDTENLPF